MSKARLSQRSNNSSTKSDFQLPDDPSHWAHHVHETTLSLINDYDLDLLLMRGGSENGEMCWVGGIHDDEEGMTFHSDSKLSLGDIFLEVENHPVVGFTTYDLVRWLRITTKNNNIISVRYVSPAYLTKDLGKYLGTRFQKHSLDHELQHTIRLNVYRRTTPCTTRPRRDGEVEGVDYKFLSVEEFQILVERGCLLESGTYAGNFYGTPLPPKQEETDQMGSPSTPVHHRRQQLGNDLHSRSHSRSDRRPEDRHLDEYPNGQNSYNPINKDWENYGGIKEILEPSLTLSQMVVERTRNGDEDDDGDDDDGDSQDALPAGWEKVDSYPEYGIFYVDHINKRTQFEHPNPKKSKKKMQDPKELHGEFIRTCLVKRQKGLGFTIVGGDEANELLQVKSIIPGGPAHLSKQLKRGDVLIEVNGHQVLGSTHREIIHLFQSIPIGTSVPITVCRGYPLAFDPEDPQNEFITTVAVEPPELSLDGDYVDNMIGARVGTLPPSHFFGHIDSPVVPPASDGRVSNVSFDGRRNSPSFETIPNGTQQVKLRLVRGHDGFRFTISDLHNGPGGQRVRSIIERTRCGDLKVGDIIERINDILVLKMTHSQVVEILKACPVGKETEFVVLRGVPTPVRSSSVTPSMGRSSELTPDSFDGLYGKVMKPDWKRIHNKEGDGSFPDGASRQQHHLSPHPRQQQWLPPSQGSQQGQGRSKTPGPVLMRSSTVGEDSQDYYSPPQQQLQQQQSNFQKRSKSSSRLFPNDNGYVLTSGVTPDFVPASKFVGAKLSIDSTRQRGDCEDLSNFNRNSSGSSSNPPPPNKVDFYGHKTVVPPIYSSSSSASATPVLGTFNNKIETESTEYQPFPVRLFRRADGFGFRLVGGSEEGVPVVSVGFIVPGGSAEGDGRMRIGDEIVSIDMIPMLGASCKDVTEAVVGAASNRGYVNLELRRKSHKNSPSTGGKFAPSGQLYRHKLPTSLSPSQHEAPEHRYLPECGRPSSQMETNMTPYIRDVRLVKNERQSFGFTIISTSANLGSRICNIVPDSPAHLSGQLNVDDLILAINGVDVRSVGHEDIVELIRSLGTMVILTVSSPLPGRSSPSSFDGTNNKIILHPQQRSMYKDSSSPVLNDHSNFNGRNISPVGKSINSRKSTSDSDVGSFSTSKFHYIEIKRGTKGFGFTITGGREFGDIPLSILKIAEGSPAAVDGNLKAEDQIVEINGQNTSGMIHSEAIKVVQSNSSKVTLLVKRIMAAD